MVDDRENKIDDRDRKSDELSLSLQNKKGKDYYDTVSELAKKREGQDLLPDNGTLSKTDKQRLVQGRNGQGNAEGRPENAGLLPSAIQVIAEDQRRTLKKNGERIGDRPLPQQSGMRLPDDSDSLPVGLSGELKRNVEDRVVEWAKQNGCWIKRG